MKVGELVSEVAKRTEGSKGDPLTEEEVGQVVRETLTVLAEQDSLRLALEDDDEGRPDAAT